MSNLSRISQLTGANFEPSKLYSSARFISLTTGFSDPIYAEAYVKMHGFDILLGLSPFYTHDQSLTCCPLFNFPLSRDAYLLAPPFIWAWT